MKRPPRGLAAPSAPSYRPAKRSQQGLRPAPLPPRPPPQPPKRPGLSAHRGPNRPPKTPSPLSLVAAMDRGAAAPRARLPRRAPLQQRRAPGAASLPLCQRRGGGGPAVQGRHHDGPRVWGPVPGPRGMGGGAGGRGPRERGPGGGGGGGGSGCEKRERRRRGGGGAVGARARLGVADAGVVRRRRGPSRARGAAHEAPALLCCFSKTCCAFEFIAHVSDLEPEPNTPSCFQIQPDTSYNPSPIRGPPPLLLLRMLWGPASPAERKENAACGRGRIERWGGVIAAGNRAWCERACCAPAPPDGGAAGWRRDGNLGQKGASALAM